MSIQQKLKDFISNYYFKDIKFDYRNMEKLFFRIKKYLVIHCNLFKKKYRVKKSSMSYKNTIRLSKINRQTIMKKKFSLILFLSLFIYNTLNATEPENGYKSNNKLEDFINYDSPVYDFNNNQLNNFQLAYKYGKAINYPKVMMALMKTESDAINVPIGDKGNSPFKRSYGIMQIKIGTYYWMLNAGYLYRENLLDEEVLHKLMYNKSFNIYAATSYYRFLLDKCNDYTEAIVAYNTGYCVPPKSKPKVIKAGKRYLNKVNKFLKFINKYEFNDYIKRRAENNE